MTGQFYRTFGRIEQLNSVINRDPQPRIPRTASKCIRNAIVMLLKKSRNAIKCIFALPVTAGRIGEGPGGIV